MWLSSISELLERQLISSPEAKKEESRNSKGYGSYIAGVNLKIYIYAWQFQCSPIAGSHRLLGGDWQWGEAAMRSVLVYSQFASDEPWRPGRSISADTWFMKLPCNIRCGFTLEKKIPVIFNLFLSLITKILESMIPGSKSNKSYEFLHCVTVLVKSWSWQSHLTLSRWLVWIMWVTDFLFYFECVLGATKGAVFLLPYL